jgi:glycerol-3-phosphate acyltransferase PlsX
MAVMGAAMARSVFDLDRPTVGLLNIGVEEIKGVEEIREAGRILRELDLRELNYRGFVEGDDLGKGTVDVVVTEGFAGNIALKAAEGTAKLVSEYLNRTFRSSVMAGLGYILARPALRKLRKRLDPRRYNGAVFLGLNGIAVKSHGGTDAIGFAHAVGVAVDMVRHGLIEKIRSDYARMAPPAPESRAAAL